MVCVDSKLVAESVVIRTTSGEGVTVTSLEQAFEGHDIAAESSWFKHGQASLERIIWGRQGMLGVAPSDLFGDLGEHGTVVKYLQDKVETLPRTAGPHARPHTHIVLTLWCFFWQLQRSRRKQMSLCTSSSLTSMRVVMARYTWSH